MPPRSRTACPDPTSRSSVPPPSQFLIGRVVKAETIVSSSWEATDDFHPDDTDVLADYERSEFLDLAQPLLPQLWHAKFSKAFYLEQVHQPRHVSYSARLFPWPALEALTLTPWYIIPLVWGPITLTFTLLSLLQFSPETRDLTFRSALAGLAQGSLPGWWSYAAVAKTGACWTVGMFLWTLLEYGFHRCLFHVDEKLPDANWALLLHFLLHGVHHYLPMVRPVPGLRPALLLARSPSDVALTLAPSPLPSSLAPRPQDGMRLVMPPTLFFMLQLPFTNLAHALFPASVANGLICGAFTAYICYDCFHYLCVCPSACAPGETRV